MKHANEPLRPLRSIDRALKLHCRGLVLLCALCASDAALAQSAAADDSLTWHGITLYGVVDIGLQYDTHGAPFTDFHPAGSSDIVQKTSRQSVFGVTPSNMGQSKIGLQGVEPITGDWQAIFKLETFFNPQSGDISDGLKSQVVNNGVALGSQTVNIDSSVAGQPFQNAYGGISSATFGTLTFGRQTTVLSDGITKYEPNYGSQAFSLLGLSGAYMGGGDTEDKRLDSSLKYTATFANMFHVGALFKFNGSNGASNTARQLNLGGEYAGASVDAYYSKINDAISVATLSSTQVAGLPALGYSVSNSLSGTISDNTTYAIMGSYKISTLKFFAGYEHMKFANPAQPLNAGFIDIGGYVLAFVNNAAYDNDKVLQVYWGGARYTVIPNLDLVVAYYGYHQNAYGTGTQAGCSTNAHGTCSGRFEAFSFDADYTLTKHFDVYAGLMYSGVHDGVASGYIYQTTNINPTVGVRYKF